MNKREVTQSIAVSEEEQFLIRVLAAAFGIKPATAARQLLFRGLAGYLEDRELRQPRHESDVREELAQLVVADAKLRRVGEVVRAEMSQKAGAKGKKPGRFPAVSAVTEGAKKAGRNKRA